jgi:hypothetical protein
MAEPAIAIKIMPHRTSLTLRARAGKFARRVKTATIETIRNDNAAKTQAGSGGKIVNTVFDKFLKMP